MSEYEQQPTMRVPLDTGEYLDATPENTRLYTFIGRGALDGVAMDNEDFDHIYIQTGEIEENPIGSFAFRVNPVTGETQEMFKQMVGYMAQHKYPMRLNELTVPDCDKESFKRMRDQAIKSACENMDDFIPDWFDEDGTSED